ncbi:hypothetical protein [Methylobacterium sp. 37f]|uniref:hypothetical protein n=1 Tax=Methylobacterium sp. 37f TaxID=2817058 RepID=UPI001FFD52CA|nr:hypothetical protein [Methylobacterium sp. 37f]MCK2056942.1 hypothetical protein [Methylobacterium sp. 37f]
MRNSFARLATRDTARPSLRERAASLKASASRVIRRKPADTAAAAPAAALAADPILAAIAETRRLTMARTCAYNVELPAGETEPSPEQNAATDAFFAHVNGVLLKTVPTTAAGCVALARYAGKFLEDEGYALDEDEANEQHVRILDLIACSPMLEAAPSVRPAGPLLSVIGRYQAARDAWGVYSNRIRDEGWDALGGFDLASAEEQRLSLSWSDLATEVLGTTPATEAGRWALASFVEAWVADYANTNGAPQDSERTAFGEVYPALLKALRASVPSQG